MVVLLRKIAFRSLHTSIVIDIFKITEIALLNQRNFVILILNPLSADISICFSISFQYSTASEVKDTRKH